MRLRYSARAPRNSGAPLACEAPCIPQDTALAHGLVPIEMLHAGRAERRHLERSARIIRAADKRRNAAR